ncbi:DUF6781 family protein [Sulfurirhabdus autotrophica]|uniref:Uncharacterized protein n=1 Tax=Sulfurirhabdus autotrophica TaxID=1706046 RepID=A0A4R3YDZ1_9PROT|nr:DUF6781 family protein [Sulfurirhabdus autotrophica]TCV90357.1 hypothetical protein EDC63_101327 [Sulfurirhabdus autotrophica]
MSEIGQNTVSDESLKGAISESVQQDKDIRTRVRDTTIQALNSKSLDTKEIKSVIKSVTEGINLGLDKRSGEIKSALSEAIAGLDEALMKSAQATHLALRQLTSQSKDFTDHELKDALDNLKLLEEDFLSTVSHVAEGASSKVKQEMTDLITHARRAGTDTGAKVAEAVNEFGSRLKSTLDGSATTGKEAAREVSKRLATIASGIFSGLADALHEKSKK